MNILVIGRFYTEGFALHIAETLSVMGHAVRRFEPGVKDGRIKGRLGHRLDQISRMSHSVSDSLPAVRKIRMKRLWKTAEEEPSDITIVCHDFLWPEEVAELKQRTGSLVAFWFPDHLANFQKGFFMNAPYDGLFFKDPFIVHILGDVLARPVYYLPECFNPDRHLISEESVQIAEEYRCDLTTAGNQHSYRVAFFKHLKDYDVKLWGNPPPLWLPTGAVAQMYQGKGVYNNEKAEAFLGAKIVINNLQYGEIWGLNVRAFEIAGIGGFQLVDWRPGLDQLFKDGEEIITFSGIKDLKDKINYFLVHDNERHIIAEAGQKRALAEHTYVHRLQLLLDTVSGKEKGYLMPDLQLWEDKP